MAAIRRCRSPEGPWVLGVGLRKRVHATCPPANEVKAQMAAPSAPKIGKPSIFNLLHFDENVYDETGLRPPRRSEQPARGRLCARADLPRRPRT
jgi:hypothetical protein